MVTKKPYQGEERRSEYCPVHHIKCQEWKDTKEEMKTRVPIWIFKIFIGVIITVLGYMNYSAISHHQELIEALNDHMAESTKIFGRINSSFSNITHSLNEIGMNQRSVMKKIELEFQHLPEYGERRAKD